MHVTIVWDLIERNVFRSFWKSFRFIKIRGNDFDDLFEGSSESSSLHVFRNIADLPRFQIFLLPKQRKCDNVSNKLSILKNKSNGNFFFLNQKV